MFSTKLSGASGLGYRKRGGGASPNVGPDRVGYPFSCINLNLIGWFSILFKSFDKQRGKNSTQMQLQCQEIGVIQDLQFLFA
jgi:hypothetical protein